MRFSVIAWLGNSTLPVCLRSRKRQELNLIWDVPTIVTIDVNQYHKLIPLSGILCPYTTPSYFINYLSIIILI